MTAQTVLIAAPVVVPLLSAGIALLLSPTPSAQRALGFGVLVALVADAGWLIQRVDTMGTQVVHAGGYHPPLGITLVADRLSALALLTAVIVCLTVFTYATGQGIADRRIENVPSVFYPTYLVLLAGIALVFLTGDLFTMYVGFEVMLMSSYVLITLGPTAERVRAAMTYMVTSLTASILLLTTIGLVYAVTGTVNLAQLAGAIPDLDSGMRQLLGLLLLLALGIKAGMVPLHWWLPDSYPTAPAPVTAVFAALLTKVGVYAIIRTQSLLFPRDEPWTLLLVLAGLTMIVGVLGALTQDNLNRVLSFALVSHIGFMLFGLAISSVAGLAGATIYLVHHITVQASLFLVAGLLERHHGTVSLARLGGVAAGAPVLTILFLLPALSLGGIPPFAGFVAKLSLLQAAAARATPLVLAVAGVALLVSLLTLAALTRVYLKAFWGEPEHVVPDLEPDDLVEVGTGRRARPMHVAAGTAVCVGLAVAAAAGPLSAFAQRAAEDLSDRTAYRTAVLDLRGDR
ncbi:MAG TPA: Na+/H+ antiporter subunit D [Nocardioidaceae bacterium]|nr:Na+/H+ antiporter subunit D [Nocardioidaceae bacterium]